MDKLTGLLNESGDRWQLDTLIPERDRAMLHAQYPKHNLGVTSVSKQVEATKPSQCTDMHIDPSLRYHTPIYSAIETMLELQRRLRGNDIPEPGDRLL